MTLSVPQLIMHAPKGIRLRLYTYKVGWLRGYYHTALEAWIDDWSGVRIHPVYWVPNDHDVDSSQWTVGPLIRKNRERGMYDNLP